MRFPRSQKLGQAGQFLRLRTEGRRMDTGVFFVWFRHRSPGETDVGKPRFAINASARVGCAVVRNRLKRVLREVFRLNQAELPGDVDVWVQLKTGADGVRPDELKRRFLEAAKRFRQQGNRPPRTTKQHAP